MKGATIICEPANISCACVAAKAAAEARSIEERVLRAVEEERETKEAAARAKRRDEDLKRQEAEAKQRRELEAKVMTLKLSMPEVFQAL